MEFLPFLFLLFIVSVSASQLLDGRDHLTKKLKEKEPTAVPENNGETKKEGYVLEIVSILLGLVFLIIVCCAYRLEARESSERLSLLDQNYEGYGLNLPISTGLMFTSSNGWKGLTEIEFRRIKEFVYNSNYNDEDKCAICLMEYLDGDVVKNLPCNHLFHKVCASSWLTRNGCCPLCKSDVSKLLSMSNENNFT